MSRRGFLGVRYDFHFLWEEEESVDGAKNLREPDFISRKRPIFRKWSREKRENRVRFCENNASRGTQIRKNASDRTNQGAIFWQPLKRVFTVYLRACKSLRKTWPREEPVDVDPQHRSFGDMMSQVVPLFDTHDNIFAPFPIVALPATLYDAHAARIELDIETLKMILKVNERGGP